MGDWPRLVNLRRCARAASVDSGEANNTTFALYNNSLGPELILVWQINYYSAAGNPIQLSYQQMGPLGTVSSTVNVVPGDAPPPGILSSGDSLTVFSPDFFLGAVVVTQGWPATFPLAVLLPGWSLVIQNQGGGVAENGVSVFWEGILSKYFDRVHTMAQLELDLIAQSGG